MLRHGEKRLNSNKSNSVREDSVWTSEQNFVNAEIISKYQVLYLLWEATHGQADLTLRQLSTCLMDKTVFSVTTAEDTTRQQCVIQ